MIFYHSVLPDAWAQFSDKDYYEADSLHSEGFIHASFEEQLEETLRIYFKGHEKVVILKIDEAKMEPELRVEKSRKGEFFPHIYGPLNKSAIIDIEERKL